VRINGRVGQAERPELICESAQQNELFVSARERLRRFVGLRIVPDVAKKSIKNGAHPRASGLTSARAMAYPCGAFQS